MATVTSNKLVLVIATIILPPLGVFLKEGLSTSFWICVLLTILFFLPGLIYGLIQVL